MSDIFRSDKILFETPVHTLDSFGKRVSTWSELGVFEGSLQLKTGNKSVLNGENKYRYSYRFYSDPIGGFTDEVRAYHVLDQIESWDGVNVKLGRYTVDIVIKHIDEDGIETELVRNTHYQLLNKSDYYTQLFDRDIYQTIGILDADYIGTSLMIYSRYYIKRFKIVAFNVHVNELQETDLINEF